jgi:hypothetical protein
VLFAAERAYQQQIRTTPADGLGLLFPEARGRAFTAAEMEAAGLGVGSRMRLTGFDGTGAEREAARQLRRQAAGSRSSMRS